ncbi:PH domain-containing protein [Microlunatus speluncae]|uniref:PH domain-containing protein n=1 Tax=Microlunatus speluncae TaxID=2594267 RepID=UPI00126610FD|nr:PH domain-containing protein [Microlunatus speluncae]
MITTADGPDWQRLHPRTTLAGVVLAAGALIAAGVPVAIALLIGGVAPGWVAFWVGGSVVVLTAGAAVIEIFRVRATDYRIHGDRLELRFRLIGSSIRSLPLQRIRAVDLTADVVQRRLGLSAVRFGTGDQTGTEFRLIAVATETAEDLRTAILGEVAGRAGRDRTGRLATFEPAWVRYAPVSLGTPVIGIGVFGAATQVASWFDAVPTLWRTVSGLMAAIPLPLQILILLAVALVIGVIGSVALYVESWWGYQLDRDADGTLHLQRGLLVRRSSSFQGARIRGVTLLEPLGYRRTGAAMLRVVAVGVETSQQDESKHQVSSTIVPPAPRSVATAVAEAITRTPVPAELRAHPPAAAHRRYRWSAAIFVTVLALLAVPAILLAPELWWLVGGAAVIGAPVTWFLARDAAAGLGHLIIDDRVILRSGSVFRSTEVLAHDGLLGWNLKRSPAQRRLGLCTLVATSAASPGQFRLPDVAPAQAVELQRTSGPVWDRLWERSVSG